jgi:uncharacterized protein (TIGR02594 family)
MSNYGSSDYGGGDTFSGGNYNNSYANNFASDGSNGLFDNSGMDSAGNAFGQAGMDQFDQSQYAGAGQGYGADPSGVGPQNYTSPSATAVNQQIAQDPTQQLQGSVPQQVQQPGQGGVGQQQRQGGQQGGQPQQASWLDRLVASLNGGQQNLGFGEGGQQGPQSGWSQWNGQPGADQADANFAQRFGTWSPQSQTNPFGRTVTSQQGGALADEFGLPARQAPAQVPMPQPRPQQAQPQATAATGSPLGGAQQQLTEDLAPYNLPPMNQNATWPGDAQQTAAGGTSSGTQDQTAPRQVQTQPYTPSTQQQQDGGGQQQGGGGQQRQSPIGNLTRTIEQNLQRMGLGGLSSILAPLFARAMMGQMGGRGMPGRGGFGGRGGMMMGRGGRGRGRGGRGGFGGGRGGFMRLPPGMRGQVMNPGGMRNFGQQGDGSLGDLLGGGQNYDDNGNPVDENGNRIGGDRTGGAQQQQSPGPDYISGSTPQQRAGMNESAPGQAPTGVTTQGTPMGGTPGSFSTAQPAAPANLIPAGQSTIGGADPSMLSNQPMGGGTPQALTPGPAGPPSQASDTAPGGASRVPDAVAAANGQPNNSAPARVLSGARQAAMAGGPGGVARFMAQNGYPKAGNWCGEFAGAVMHSQGIAVPRNPAIASNWRNWGRPTNNPRPGDVVVRQYHRGQYVPTGSTGSHVAMVDRVNGDGTMTIIGGNQGAMRETVNMRGWDFRTMGSVPSTQARAVAQNPAWSY